MSKTIVSNPNSILLLAILAMLPMAPVQAQDAGAYSGLINNQVRQQMYLQRTMPYLTRPATPEDFKPGPPDDEPVILYSEQDIQGKVIPSVPPADELHVK
jgi:hypothetical protein